MTFQPVVPTDGIGGWKFLQRTYDTQFETFSKSSQMERDTTYFEQNIAEVKTAADLVANKRLLRVALGAFGLSEDINSNYFIQKILEDGTKSDDALANRLSDQRYQDLSKAFGFGPGEIRRTGLLTDMAAVVDKHKTESFEQAVGETDDSMRVALYAQRELTELAASEAGDTAKWFTIMGLPPMREMFEVALALPGGLAKIDLDQQLGIFKDKLLSVTGSSEISQFTDPEAMERLTNLYLARSQINGLGDGYSSGATALALLQS
jgi:Protein of unknown function (DUF1217)